MKFLFFLEDSVGRPELARRSRLDVKHNFPKPLIFFRVIIRKNCSMQTSREKHTKVIIFF